MARIIPTVSFVLLLNFIIGCHHVDSGRSQIMPPRVKAAAGTAAEVPKGSEADIIEQMATNRAAYRHGLEALIAHYNKTGDHMKLTWAQDELHRLDKMPQYNYIIAAGIAGPELKAAESIPLANYIYQDGVRLEKNAKMAILIIGENTLRTALDKYNQVIRNYPTSDKIDDAAFRAAGIYEYFEDYTIALVYYQRAYQWDANTPHPARFKVAYLLDQHMSRRAEALELYKEALAKEKLSQSDKTFVQKRIEEITQSAEGSSKQK